MPAYYLLTSRTKIKMTINTLIDILMQIARLEERRPSLSVAAAAAEDELSKAVAGYKTTIARCKVREAAAALTELDQQLAALQNQTVGSEETMLYFAKSFATYTLKLEALTAARTTADKQLADALEESKKGAWKWQGRKDAGEPAPLLAARKEIAALVTQSEALEKSYSSTKVIIEDHRAEELKDIEFKAWLAGGPKPEFVRLSQEKERDELLKGCVVLKLPTKGMYQITATPIVAEGDTEAERPEGMSDPDWWCMTMEEYIAKHVLPPLEPMKEKEKEKTVTFKAKPATTSWLVGFQKRRDQLKAEKAA